MNLVLHIISEPEVSPINWVELCLAAGAIIAVFVSFLTLYQAWKFKQAENFSKRSILAPADHPGFLRVPEELGMDPVLKIDIVNSGNNPCNEITGDLICLTLGNDSKGYPIYEPLITQIQYCNNPVTHNGRWLIQLSMPNFTERGIEELTVLMIKFIIFKIRYTDIVLKQSFDDVFIWEKSAEGDLTEAKPSDYESLLSLSQNINLTPA